MMSSGQGEIPDRRYSPRALGARFGEIPKPTVYSLDERRPRGNARRSVPGDDFRALAANFDPQINDGRGIVTEISTMAGRRLVGSYAANGSLSLVELVKNRGKKVLFIENDLSMGDALSPVISTVVDQLIAAAASPRFTGRGRIFLFLDELPTLRVKKLAMALTLLRQNRLCVIAGVQNIDRRYMNEPNNRSEIDALLASFQNLILMRNDGNTAGYISSRLGKTKVRDRFDNPDGSAGFSIREEAVIETEELRSLGIGDAFCRLGYDPAFRFHFNRYTIRNG